MAKSGERVMVSRIGGTDDVRQHLQDLGFVVGSEVEIVSAPGNGNVIVKLRDSRLAITAKMAEKVMVTM
ncbi:FeoA family protein [Clostridium vitabionis]|uniref:FeoA family protein n=1 Tax=Clostridium vitabionis TaxID=2784388 RepID=UPI001F384C90|nr:FeoA family protein [Clostridium vitabionis]